MKRFADKVIIVTGGASGIGAATVRRLHDEGASVVAADLDESRVQAMLDETGYIARTLAVGVDVSDPEQVDLLFRSCVERFGIPDGLANCAGVRGVGSIVNTDPDLFRRNMEVNVAGSFYTCQAFARAAIDAGRHGAIVNVSSVGGIQGVSNRLAYVTAKHGVIGLTRGAALDLGPAGIRVNVVAPGTVLTPMTASMFETTEAVERVRAVHPLGREGKPEEIASVIAFLLSEDASFMTGAIVPVDGGSTVGRPAH
jgi:NAD(P)-dependent dehydrogenase (short-subunit alcohol dehydrogenase family)